MSFDAEIEETPLEVPIARKNSINTDVIDKRALRNTYSPH